ncbi:hypothetical protein ACHAP5_003473 [Fusarium lateritium]
MTTADGKNGNTITGAKIKSDIFQTKPENADKSQTEGDNPEAPESAKDAQAPVTKDSAKTDVEKEQPSEGKDTSTPTTTKGKPSLEQPQWSQRVTSDGFTNGLAYEWLTDVTTRVATLEKKNDDKKEEKDSKTETDDAQRGPVKFKPTVRDCNWEQFKNRYSAEDCSFAIETLLASNDLDRQMGDEQLRRLPAESRKGLIEETRDDSWQEVQVYKYADAPRMERLRINSPAIMRFLRKAIGESSWSTRPHTFLRPFKLMIHSHDKVENEFQNLEEAFQKSSSIEAVSAESLEPQAEKTAKVVGGTSVASSEKPTTAESVSDGPQDHDSKEHVSEDHSTTSPNYVQSNISTTKEEPDTVEASGAAKLEDGQPEPDIFSREDFDMIRCYMEFARNRLLEPYHMFDKLNHTHQPKVRYDDLWSLFRSGELVVEREVSSRLDKDSHRSVPGKPRGPKLFRIFYVSSETLEWKLTNLESESGEIHRYKRSEPDPINIQAYYIDFDGTSYAGVDCAWEMSRFQGEEEVTKLKIYPVRFHKDSDKLLKDFRQRGQRFTELLKEKHLCVEHNGWTLNHNPVGDHITGVNGNKESVEYIDSDVIIDFQEAYQAQPSWKPGFSSFIKITGEPCTEYDEFAVIEWSGPDRATAKNKFKELVLETDCVAALEWNTMFETDNYVSDSVERSIEAEGAKQNLTDEDLCLLPSRLLVYSLRHRKFVHAHVESLKQPPTMSNPFDELKIPHARKHLIKSIVQDHFDKKSILRDLETEGLEPMEQDFIRGKGKGLIILLHGAPGVGKTATAEAVAYAHRKPLFPITCGDLGVNPVLVESTLSMIFRLANLWDCVLLLDEAEIFLSRREKKDDNLQRNALVSIFLRTLEYYPGILFLTTNRVGALDEALTSRVHVSIFFPYLNMQQTVDLFSMNLKRSEMIAEQRATRTKAPKLIIKHDEIKQFAEDQFLDRPSQSSPWWNGRQIRNAFQIATSLAYADSPDDVETPQRFLRRHHFEQVLKFIKDYEQYRLNLFQKTDNELALEREERTQVPSHVHSRQDPYGSDLSLDPYRPSGYPQPMPPYTPASNPRTVPRFVGRESQDYGSPARRRERSPMYSGPSGGGAEPRQSQGGWSGREYDHYGGMSQEGR